MGTPLGGVSQLFERKIGCWKTDCPFLQAMEHQGVFQQPAFTSIIEVAKKSTGSEDGHITEAPSDAVSQTGMGARCGSPRKKPTLTAAMPLGPNFRSPRSEGVEV